MKRALLIVLLLFALTASFHFQDGYNDREHLQFHAALDELGDVNADFDENLLRTRFSLLENYDRFERDQAAMERLAAQLQAAPRFVSKAGRVEIATSAGKIAAVLHVRRQLFEQFKSHNAVFTNSRRHFPAAVSELAQRLAGAAGESELRAVVQELSLLVLAETVGGDSPLGNMLAGPERLEAWSRRHSDNNEAALAANLARHAQQMIEGKKQVDGITHQLLALPVATAIERTASVYEQELEQALQRSHRYRAFLYTAAALLAVAIGSAWWLQRGANHRLKARVTEHTRQLEAEVEERTRTEAALRASEGLLNSLIENLPALIFRKDRAGRFTFANPRLCARFGRTREELIGLTVFDLLAPADAAKQHEFDQRIMARRESYDAIESLVDFGRGTPGFVHLIKVPLVDAAGDCVGVQGMCFDVTELKRAEAKLAEASALLEALLQNSPDQIYFKDRDSRFVRFSQAVLRKLGGRDESHLLGRTDRDLFAPEHAEAAFRDEQEIIRTGVPLVGKLEKETYPDGHVTWALTTKMPWRDASGAIVGIFGITKDVTPLKNVEDKLAYERDQLRALLDASPDTIYFKDLESRFVLVSRSKVQEIIERIPDLREQRAFRGLAPDVPPTELLNGLSDFDTYQGDTAQLALADEQAVIRTGQPIIGKLEKLTFPDGTVQWSLTSKMPWRDAEGRIIGTFGLSKDVTSQHEAEEKIQQMHQQLMEASRQAGMAEVATGVLHNVGNVLNSVNVSSTLIADHVRRSKALNVVKLAALFEQNKADLAEFVTRDPRGQMIPAYLHTLADSIAGERQALTAELENLRKNVEHIKDIVAMQQAYARTSGVMEAISVPDMVEDALRINSGSLARHDVDTVRDYQARPVVVTDKHKVMQILINLVRNAKYACDESGRGEKVITVKISREEQHVKIAVADNGIGIRPENLTRIFAHGFTTRKDGHGFGLHSGALAARELGGDLSVHSDGPGHGAIFTLSLPAKSEGTSHE